MVKCMNNKNMVPKIRFNAYTVNWRHCKFSDLIQTMHGGASIAPADYRESGIPTVPKGAINSTGTANLSGSKYVSKEFFEKKISSCVYPGSLVTSLRDLVPTAPNMGRIVKLKGQDDKYLMPQGVYRLNLNNDVNERFLISFSNSNKYRKIISQEKNGSTQVHIRSSQYLGVNLSVPSSEEQEKIGSFFNKLDKTITLQQQLLNDHKQLKKAMLQKMFPQKGESVPRVRFAGFNGNWREKELSELAERFDNLRIPITSSERIAGSTPYYGANGIQGYIEGYTHDGEFILVAEDGANDLKNYPVQYVSGKVWVNNHAHVLSGISGTTDNYFLMNSIKQTNIEPFLLGGGRAKLNANIMMKIKFYIPDVIEQKKIGKFFKQLDETIALHENKLGTYQELKKAMLQKMFV